MKFFSGGRMRLSFQYGLAFLAAPVCCLLSAWLLRSFPADPWWLLHEGSAFVRLILFYPIVEELAFRGVIQEYLAGQMKRQYLGGLLSASNLVTSLLFTAIHFVHHPPLWAVAVVVPSLIFGYFRERFGSVIPAVVLHAFYNGVFFSFMGS